MKCRWSVGSSVHRCVRIPANLYLYSDSPVAYFSSPESPWWSDRHPWGWIQSVYHSGLGSLSSECCLECCRGKNPLPEQPHVCRPGSSVDSKSRKRPKREKTGKGKNSTISCVGLFLRYVLPVVVVFLRPPGPSPHPEGRCLHVYCL